MKQVIWRTSHRQITCFKTFCALPPPQGHQNQLQDHQNHPQDHQNRLQGLPNHTYKEPPQGGLLIGVVLMVLELILVFLGVVLVVLEANIEQ